MAITIWSLEDAKKYHVHSPGLAAWLVQHLHKKYTVIDFGCGLGKYVQVLSENDFHAIGYEGTPGIKQIAVSKNVFEWDITKPMGLYLKHTSICIEVMEHLLPLQEDAALRNITWNCNLLVLSWAVPGQAGHGHNNCRPANYVKSKLNKFGFTLSKTLTESARHAAAGTDPYLQFFRESVYVFIPIRQIKSRQPARWCSTFKLSTMINNWNDRPASMQDGNGCRAIFFSIVIILCILAFIIYFTACTPKSTPHRSVDDRLRNVYEPVKQHNPHTRH